MFESLFLLSIVLIIFSQFLPIEQPARKGSTSNNKKNKIALNHKPPNGKTKPHRKASGRAKNVTMVVQITG